MRGKPNSPTRGMENNMKDIIIGILLFCGLLMLLSLLASFISRGTIYSDAEKARQLNQCILQGLSYQQCYRGIYIDGTAFKQTN